ncbi:MAG: NADH-quinone oxidoreductase subunit NuoH [Acidobacteriia bacterium]|nr:NADH-quinone oxidoreductase subunit NuoH [Terriglobia bacterium]
MVEYFVIPAVQIVVVFLAVSVMVAYMTYLERKVVAFMQARLGPMRVGYWGLLQPIADAVKLMIKEDIIPAGADKLIFTLGPVITLIPAFAVFSVIPFSGSQFSVFGYKVHLYITDVNVGILFILALSSIGVLGIILGGWSSNSKYPLLGSLRSAAQMVSYEVAMGFSVVSVLLYTHTLSMVQIVEAQKNMGWWFAVIQPIGFIIYLICGVAETNRAPFDLPEAESELVAGFHTEYSGFRFALYFLAEYANMILISSIAVTLFWGGWLAPFPNVKALAFLQVIPGLIWFLLKVYFFLYLYIWLRATLPRFRYDQLMRVGWKFLIPVAMANVILTAVLRLYLK